MSLKAYRLIYRNILMAGTVGAAFAIFGSASWFFRVAPINLRTSRIPAMENRQRVVLEVSNYLEKGGPPQQLLPPKIVPPPVLPPPSVEEARATQELPQAEIVETPVVQPDETPPYNPVEEPQAAPDAPVEVQGDLGAPVFYDPSAGAHPVEAPPVEEPQAE